MTEDSALQNDGRTASKDPMPKEVPIFIDGTKYHPTGDKLTGIQLRELPMPPVAADRDLWFDIVDELDQLVEDDEVIDLVLNMRFFTVPRVINPGQTARG